MPKPRILVVLHQEHSTPGRIGHWLVEHGCTLDIRRPRFDDPLPATMDDHAGAVIFGGPMSANDPDDYVRREIDWIGVPLKARKPFLGICLGAQMLAKHLGAKVYVHPRGRAEIGYYPLRPTDAGLTLSSEPFPGHVYHWHREGFDLATGAELLAEGDDFAVQAMRYGTNALGLQFHPEVTYQMICRWSVLAADRMGAPGAQNAHLHRAGWHQHDPAFGRWSRAMLLNWLKAQPALPVEARPSIGQHERPVDLVF